MTITSKKIPFITFLCVTIPRIIRDLFEKLNLTTRLATRMTLLHQNIAHIVYDKISRRGSWAGIHQPCHAFRVGFAELGAHWATTVRKARYLHNLRKTQTRSIWTASVWKTLPRWIFYCSGFYHVRGQARNRELKKGLKSEVGNLWPAVISSAGAMGGLERTVTVGGFFRPIST